MKRSEIRADQCHEALDSATLYPGYLLEISEINLADRLSAFFLFMGKTPKAAVD